jgi:hypothetical protein
MMTSRSLIGMSIRESKWRQITKKNLVPKLKTKPHFRLTFCSITFTVLTILIKNTLYQESTNPQLTSSFLLRESTVLAVQSRSDVTLPRINHILLDDLIVKLVNPQLSTPEDNQSDGKQRRFFYGHRLLRWRRRRRLSTLQHLHSGVGAVAPWQFLRGVVKYHVTDRQRGHDEPNQRAQEQIERNEPLPVLQTTNQH